jgi:hypothetical protein
METGPLFTQRTLIIWVSATVMAFAVALFFLGRPDAVDPVGPTVESRSALGYAGIADLLRQFGAPVVASHSHSRDRLGDGGVLVLAEPRLDPLSFDRARKLIAADAVLLILPKWNGVPDPAHPGWIQQADVTIGFEPETALALVGAEGTVERGPPAPAWDHNVIGVSPIVSAPMQFIRSTKMRPLIAAGDQILVGEMDKHGRKIIVVADPDILSNAGLAHPVNAAFAIALIGRLRTGDGPVVFDEALAASGGAGPNIMKYLFRFPLLAATVPGLVALVLLLWSAIPRFGAPEPEPPALESGKRGLIRNIAALMTFAGHRAPIVRRLVEATVHDVAGRLHAPPQLGDRQLTLWLSRIGAARGVSLDCAEIQARAETVGVDRDTLVALARDINRWKQDMLNGPR